MLSIRPRWNFRHHQGTEIVFVDKKAAFDSYLLAIEKFEIDSGNRHNFEGYSFKHKLEKGTGQTICDVDGIEGSEAKGPGRPKK